MAVSTYIVVFAVAFCVFDTEAQLDKEWQAYKQAYGKDYSQSNDPNEDAWRKKIFIHNMGYIEKENTNLTHTYTLGCSPFTDWTAEELRNLVMPEMPSGVGMPNSGGPPTSRRVPVDSAPDAADFTTRNNPAGRPLTTAVKNQGQCGSCWAFSAVEMMESRYLWYGGFTPIPLTLSVQQFLDCTPNGCKGGWPEYAYEKALSEHGVESESNYPYVAPTIHSCGYDCNKAAFGGIMLGNWHTLSKDETEVRNYLGTYGPLSACGFIGSGWYNYVSGIYNGNCNDPKMGHCFQLVGYDVSDAASQYWTIRNTWGSDWGESGLIRLLYGGNTCDIMSHVTDVDIFHRNKGTSCGTRCTDGSWCGCPCSASYNKCSDPPGHCYTSASDGNESLRIPAFQPGIDLPVVV